MGPKYVRLKIAFLVVALFTLTFQCAAQCVARPCHDIQAKGMCHRHQPTNDQVPLSSCKASLLVAEVRSGSDHGRVLSAHIYPLSMLPPAAPGGISTAELSRKAWPLPKPPLLPVNLGAGSPLRI